MEDSKIYHINFDQLFCFQNNFEMTTFKIDFNYFTQEFDQDYPIILKDTGVNPQEFQQTLHFLAERTKEVYKYKTKSNLMILLSIICLIFILIGSMSALLP